MYSIAVYLCSSSLSIIKLHINIEIIHQRYTIDLCCIFYDIKLIQLSGAEFTGLESKNEKMQVDVLNREYVMAHGAYCISHALMLELLELSQTKN